MGIIDFSAGYERKMQGKEQNSTNKTALPCSVARASLWHLNRYIFHNIPSILHSLIINEIN